MSIHNDGDSSKYSGHPISILLVKSLKNFTNFHRRLVQPKISKRMAMDNIQSLRFLEAFYKKKRANQP